MYAARFYLKQHANYTCRCSEVPLLLSVQSLTRFRLLHIIGTTLVVVALICFALLRVMLCSLAQQPLDAQLSVCVL
jgi:hypothetical protein